MHFLKFLIIGFVIGCGFISLGVLNSSPAHGSEQGDEAWKITALDKRGERPLCAPSRSALYRIGTPGGRCAQQVSERERGQWVVSFTCEGVGWGRSVFRHMGAGALRIETQGIRGGEPFGADYEAQSVASCAGGR